MRRILPSPVLPIACSLLLAACGSDRNKSRSATGSTPNVSSSIAGSDVVPTSAIVFVSIDTGSTGARWQRAKMLIAGIPAARKNLRLGIQGLGRVAAHDRAEGSALGRVATE